MKRLNITASLTAAAQLTAEQKYSQKQTEKESQKIVMELKGKGTNCLQRCFTCQLPPSECPTPVQPHFALLGSSFIVYFGHCFEFYSFFSLDFIRKHICGERL